MRKVNLEKLQKNSSNSLTYLKKVEKAYIKNRLSTFKEKKDFYTFINDTHTNEELRLMQNEIELNYSNTGDLLKIIFPSITAIVVTFLSFTAIIVSIAINMKFQIDMKLMESLVLVSPNYKIQILFYLYAWFLATIVIALLAIIFLKVSQRRKLIFLAILKSINK